MPFEAVKHDSIDINDFLYNIMYLTFLSDSFSSVSDSINFKQTDKNLKSYNK